MARIIGIDLGTTNSLCAVFDGDSPRLLSSALGDPLTPSVAAVLEDGTVLVGGPAKELRVTAPGRCASMFKRLMGTDREVSLGGKTYTAPELSSLVLRALKEDAEAALGEPVTEAVITVPAYFNDLQRNATKTAGKLAGLEVRRIVNEPTAAALAYGFHDRDTEKRVLVLDLGGGTFDVTVMEIFEGALEIVSTAGASFLGGEDFTERMARWALNKQGRQLEADEFGCPLLVSRLKLECERAKVSLSTEDSAQIRIPDDEGRIADDAPVVTIEREMFEALTDELLSKMDQPVRKALRDAGRKPVDIDDVILVGGATRMPLVSKFVRTRLGSEPLCTHDPDHVVALGAAVQAALVRDEQAVSDMVMTDVCPFTLGIDISKEIGGRRVSGYYLPVIHRNTTIPCSKEETVYTLRPNQTRMSIGVYQGEARRTADNLKLGEILVTDIPLSSTNAEVRVRFTYDLNGILEVDAVVTDSGRRFSTVLTHNVKGLAKAEIETALAKMRELKFYPRDDLRNEQLLRFAERVVGEVASVLREQLESALDAFEQGLDSGDRAYHEGTRDALLATLELVGFPYDERRSDTGS